ncbi:hypothetical protein [Collinsella stercoris]|uniref:Four helix bundle protein n=1 Tax=Collinsella stercoris DSM 13279 TaxID=445975 RepID=B6GDG9_9ACTN|nr:hypothetical protein [Collinsella stercoris]EEA89608.1 hypothetical protein COLSTE_02149 [Collinsella stercoris DSM 13279]UEA45212.1 hypothetical protein LK434_08775 [Collinsella stercoris DSM 13279]UWP12263.1 hypothetical protein NQ498_03255 [Collinsella stercoris]
MSGVYARNRHLSAQKYFALALEIRAEITKKVTTKQLPKSYRFVFAVPMAETARSLVMNLVKADAFYPNTARNVEERKRFMTLAIADCNQLLQDLQCLKSLNSNISLSWFETLIQNVDDDIKLIKGARSGVKLIGKG